jgi:protoporphyrinogen oxidase
VSTSPLQPEFPLPAGGIGPVVILGGGPAGLTAAWQLCKERIASIVLEQDATVGGLARTVEYKGYRFDIGGHRFFTKARAVEEVWREILPPEDFPRRRRLSRIYYNGRFFPYPLRPWETLRGLGPVEGLLILASYLRARLSPSKVEETFEQWVTNRFGKRLYRTFFQTYTEKVWGIPAREISADWAAQRIAGLSFWTAVRSALGFGNGNGNGGPRTLVDEFDYPRRGPGMMWERAADVVSQNGCELRRQAAARRIRWSGTRVEAIEADIGGKRETIAGSHFVSTVPMRELVAMLEPAAPAHVREAASRLRHRDFLTVALIVRRADVFPDNWIYVHDASVKLGRIQNFKNWSADMVPDPSRTCLGLEYFCFENDGLWDAPDEELVALGTRELARIGLVRPEDVEDGTVVRMRKAYPIYDAGHRETLLAIRSFTDRLENLQLVGRNGTHRYNNQDHSMLTAMLAVENILGARHDLWKVNADAVYHEAAPARGLAADLEALEETQPRVPRRKRELA